MKDFLPAPALHHSDSAIPDAGSKARRPGPRPPRSCGPLVGCSPALFEVFGLIEQVASTNATVLISGETGTGKELVAQAIHELGSRSAGPFVSLNCGALTPSLIESELFGHERGSFTGADTLHRGVFEQAHGGTLLLDEITEMPIQLQVKLLRVLETRTVTRVGGSEPIEVDVRVLAATNRDCHTAVEEKELREDLLYRLLVFPIHVPPLRERTEDLELLARHFLDRLNRRARRSKKLTRRAVSQLGRHPWPGNARELRNAVERSFILSGDSIDRLELGVSRGASRTCTFAGTTLAIGIGTTLHEARRELISATVEHADGDKRAAAEQLGVSLKTVYNYLNESGGAHGGAATPSRGAAARAAHA